MLLSVLDRYSSLFAGIIDALCNPKQQRRVALGLVAAYASAWALYGVIAKSSQDINSDMAEMVIWSRELALGYPSQPPFLAYFLKLWFSIFPLADWAMTLLAVVTVSAGIYMAFEISGIWLSREKRAAVLFLLAVIPFYNFLGLKFDQNSALIPLWACASLAFLRSLEIRSLGWAALTGCAAAAAMLTKYWSAFLLVALFLIALFDDRRKAYWLSLAPWTTALTFVLLVLPHAVWLIEEKFPPLTWITIRRMSQSGWDFGDSLAEYVFGTVGYATVAIVLVAILVHPTVKAVCNSWFVWEQERRAATILFWIPLLLPIVVALVAGTDLLSLWNAPAYTLLPVMMLASPLVLVPRLALLRLATIVTALTLGAVLFSPLVAFVKLKNGVENDAAYAKLAATATERLWHETCNCPLRLVGGMFKLVNSAAFYVSDRPSTYSISVPRSPPWADSRFASPWVDKARIGREGIAIICPTDEIDCLEGMQTLVAAGPPGHRIEVTLTRHWLGLAGSSKGFIIATVPPRS